MKERPILFSGPMVRAILDGRKTQTRRVMKFSSEERAHYHSLAIRMLDDGDALLERWPDTGRAFGNFGRTDRLKCPYGVPGDRLWVRETWAHHDDFHVENLDPYIIRHGVAYRIAHQYPDPKPTRWRPSIHMPRWASRITLEITGVRVERLQDISEADARAEGIERVNSAESPWIAPGVLMTSACGVKAIDWPCHDTARDAFRVLWESINGWQSWGANPWVWVVEFKRGPQAKPQAELG